MKKIQTYLQLHTRENGEISASENTQISAGGNTEISISEDTKIITDEGTEITVVENIEICTSENAEMSAYEKPRNEEAFELSCEDTQAPKPYLLASEDIGLWLEEIDDEFEEYFIFYHLKMFLQRNGRRSKKIQVLYNSDIDEEFVDEILQFFHFC